MLRALPAFAFSLLLVAPAPAREQRLPQEGESARYVCADGQRIEILYGGGDAVVTVGESVAQMSRDAKADHELYVGGGWLWSVTGKRSGELARTASPKRVACRVG